MLARSLASLLIALVTLPFTAPFSTCELSMLTGAPASSHASSIGAEGHDLASIEQGAAQSITISVLEEEQFKTATLVVVSTVVAAFDRAETIAVAVARDATVRTPLAPLRL